MKTIIMLASIAGLAIATAPAQAANGFQNTCSNIGFAYANNQATLQAVCLAANGSAHPSALTLNGIGNNNGTLVQTSGASTFQQSCGNIQVVATAQSAMLTALCRTMNGSSNATSFPLNNIGNNNGQLTY